MLNTVLLTAGLLAIVVAVSRRHLQNWSISPPLLGLLGGVLIGPRALAVVELPPGEDVQVIHLAARLLLAVALMAVALRYPVTKARRRVREVAILVVVVMPAMMGVLAISGSALLGLPLGLALVLGASLSPTDPVLASGIVTGEAAERDVPERNRQVLSLESAANDGLAMPLVIIALAVALERSLPLELARASYEVIAGAFIGVVAGELAGRALVTAGRHREIGSGTRSLYTLVVAFTVLGLTGLLRADGLLAVFVAGLAHNRVVTGADRRAEVEVDETLNQFLVVPVFVLLGAVLPWRDWAELGWAGAGFVVAALLLRRLPVVLALGRPLRADLPMRAWLGWFGPIGVAALYYLGHAHKQRVDDPTVWAAGTLVIAASTVAHGLTAGLARVLYRRQESASAAETGVPAKGGRPLSSDG